MKKFFNRIWAFLKMLFINPEKWIDDNVKPSIEMVQNIKAAIDSPIAIALTAIIPGTWDDNLRSIFSTHLGIVIDFFVKGESILESQEPLEQKIIRLVEWLKTLTPTVRAAVLHKLASKLSIQNAGNDAVVKNHAADLLTQVTYSKIKEGVNENDLAIAEEKEPIEITPVY